MTNLEVYDDVPRQLSSPTVQIIQHSYRIMPAKKIIQSSFLEPRVLVMTLLNKNEVYPCSLNSQRHYYSNKMATTPKSSCQGTHSQGTHTRAFTQPRDTQPRDTQPRDTQPRDTQPRDTQPRDTVFMPRDTQPRDTVFMPRDTQPRDTQPRDTVFMPRDTQPRDTVFMPRDTQPRDTVFMPRDTHPSIHTAKGHTHQVHSLHAKGHPPEHSHSQGT